MSAKLPVISVTTNEQSESESSEDSNSNDMDYNFNNGNVTDVEDLDSQVDIKKLYTQKASSHTLHIPKLSERDADATDIEDYNDTDSDEDEKSNVYPELKLSLQEFLQHGLREQSMIDNEAKEKVENKAGDFLQAQNLNQTNDYLTDCEDYNTDSELENDCEKSVCVDLDTAVGEQGRVFIADRACPNNENDNSDEYEDLSILSDISELASALSDAGGAGGGARGLSEDEVMEMSGDEEECQIAISEPASENEDDENIYDSASNASLPPIDVAFISTGSQQRRKSTTMSVNKNAFLAVSNAHIEEVLTDVEKLDDSAGEDSFDSEEEEKSIPRAVILSAKGEDDDDITDVEDIFCDDNTQSSHDLNSVTEAILPPAHREMVVLKEDDNGDTIENVMPLDRDFHFGVYNTVTDDVQTEDEDYSCADDLERNGSVAECLNAENLIEDEVTVLNETLKPQLSKRLELHANTEPVTDVEEIYVDGTNRRKKLKTRSMSKGKTKLLDVVVRDKEDGGTDIEEMELSDRGLPPNLKLNANAKQPKQEDSIDKATDVEDISADEVSDMSDNEGQCGADVGSKTLKEYIVSNSNIVLTIETDGKRKSCQTLTLDGLTAGDGTNPPNTDVEDVQCPSDADDVGSDHTADETACTVNCSQLNDLLNESYTVVHEKNVNSFNAEAEKLHIKGNNIEARDAHTDIEYVESDESAARGSN
uniref:Uncharacterized protein n=1 Tax=Ceratitis capitata TaxID=7213 RepID=W8B468_CERCA